MTKTELNKTKTVVLQKIKMVIAFIFRITKKGYIMILLDSWFLGGEQINMSIMNKLKLVMLNLQMVHMVH